MKLLANNLINGLFLSSVYDSIKDSSRKPELNSVRPLVWSLVFNPVSTKNEISIWNFIYDLVKETTNENDRH